MLEDMYWKGKLLIFTWHFKRELEALGRYEEFVIEILDSGKHKLIARKQQKYKVLCPFQRKHVCLVYVANETAIILVHIKPVRKK